MREIVSEKLSAKLANRFIVIYTTLPVHSIPYFPHKITRRETVGSHYNKTKEILRGWVPVGIHGLTKESCGKFILNSLYVVRCSVKLTARFLAVDLSNAGTYDLLLDSCLFVFSISSDLSPCKFKKLGKIIFQNWCSNSCRNFLFHICKLP